MTPAQVIGSTCFTLRRFDRTSSDASEYGSATQCRDTGTWLITVGARGLSAAMPVGSPLAGIPPPDCGEDGGVAAATAAMSGIGGGSLRTDSWMVAGVPATDGIQLPELPAQFHHGSAPELPIFPDDDGALFDALYGG